MSNQLKLTTEELSELHDPKSLVKLRELGGIAALARDLRTNIADGLDPTEASSHERASQFGVNKLPETQSKGFFELAWEALQDRVLIMLSVAAIISLALGLYETFGQGTHYDSEGKPLPKVEWVEGVAIIVAIFIVVIVGAANDYQKERQFKKLNQKKENREVIVYRNGNKQMLGIYELCVGDLLHLETGDVIPADCVLVKGKCECDESSITGESKTIKKINANDALAQSSAEGDIGDAGVLDPMLISGAKVLSGMGRAIVTAVGPHSMHGRTILSLNIETEETPMQARLTKLANGIAKWGAIAALILFIVLFIRFLVGLGSTYANFSPAEKGSRFLSIIITAITIIVVAVPEGLPLAVTLALAFATTRMAKDNNLVRVLKSCETMGGATAVCSDKTGTLTENKMRVVRGMIGDRQFSSEDGLQMWTESSLVLQSDIASNVAINSTAFEGNGEDKYIGSKTEVALLLLAESFGVFQSSSLETLRQQAKIVQVIPFESSRKWGGVVAQTGENQYTFYIKGASEVVFSRCSEMTFFDGEIKPVDLNLQNTVNQTINDYAERALRTLCIAHRRFEQCESWPPSHLCKASEEEADVELLFGEAFEATSHNDTPRIVVGSAEAGLCLDGVVGIQDPLRPGVPLAVAQCKQAGVCVRMVTGDNIRTAKAIALECGILEDTDGETACIEGPKFRKLSLEERIRLVPRLRVLARSSPEDKRILVETLQKLREVVAVTGDGTNDAPALKLADVGFSMGLGGTEVAREASDIILMTDEFPAIVNAIKWGRTVASSIKKFIQFQLTVNITAVLLTFVSAVSSQEGTSVLTAVQLLWVNLIMDTLAALALATDKPDESFLQRKPAGRTAPLIAVSTWKMILSQACMQLTVTFILHYAGAKLFFGSGPITNHQQAQISSLTFNAFVWLQIFKLFVTRKLDEADGIKTVRARITRNNLDFSQHLFRNWYFITIVVIIAGFQVIIMYFGGAAFSIARQTPAMWATAILCGLISLPLGAIVRIIPDEWVVAIFPTRAFLMLSSFLSFRWLYKRKRAPKDVEAQSEECEPFVRAKKDIMYLKAHHSGNPFRKSSTSSSSSLGSTLVHSTDRSSISSDVEMERVDNYKPGISALTMIPTAVGGAVAGWNFSSKDKA